MNAKKLNIHRYEAVENEHLYGPGKRLLVFTQGCSIHCKGCVNSHLWEFGAGIDISADEIADLCSELEGVTLHGGEPLDQAEALTSVVGKIKALGKTVILFTGYTYGELNDVQRRVWLASDMVVSGRYEESKRCIYLQFRGSTNQKVYTHKGQYRDYRIKDGKSVAILTLDSNGEMSSLGFRSDELEKLLKELEV